MTAMAVPLAPALRETATAAGSSPPPVAPVRRMVWQLVPQPGLPAMPSPRLRGARIVVLGGRPVLAARVAAELRSAGALVVVASGTSGPWTVQGQVPDGLVDLTLGEPFVPTEHHGYRDRLLSSVAAIRACYRQWAEQEATDRIFYVAVTYLNGRMGYGDEPSSQPLGGIWAGLAKTLHREIPNCNTRVLDVAPDDVDELPSVITRELYRWGLFEIGYRAGRRYSLRARSEAPAPAAVRLGADDVVLVSGGGRGIGFRLATSLAEEFGCRVVVTGRQRLPSGTEPWMGLSDTEFKAYERDMWVRRPGGAGLADVRTELHRIRQLRDLARNMEEARAAGLQLSYERCDFTDAEQVEDLVARLGRPLNGVIHNAGVDKPVRLPKKTDEDFLHTVATKVDSFVTLFEQVRHLSLKFFCNVGSLTGRLGGMTGQLDYSAANEGLARLGLWADRQVPFPVMTLCWPTWNQLGMIANFEATLRYMAALDIDEGLRLWKTELTSGTSGETTFVGPLGRALGPIQARGYPPTPDLPGFADLLPRLFHLGEPRTHRPSRSQTAVVTFDRTAAPVLGDFLVENSEAVPVALLLENAVQAAGWLEPDSAAATHLTGIEDLAVRMRDLRAAGLGYTVRRDMTGRYEDSRWVVDVRYHRDQDAETVARLRLVYEPEGKTVTHPAPALRPITGGRGRHLSETAGLLRWRGLLLPLAHWRTDQNGGHFAEIRESAASDLWTVAHPPAAGLPLAALENIWWHTAHRAVAPELLTVRRITFLPTGRPRPVRVGLHGSPTGQDWTVIDARTHGAVLEVAGLAWSADSIIPPSRTE
ncbi:KR domain-containing protein [Streptomyces sp. NPDC006251]|uniref:KR domain-containing protein n=1 Tax=Streptomyces sp. NPDC006251 TaxID=3155718 RepID=UPI00339F7CC6